MYEGLRQKSVTWSGRSQPGGKRSTVCRRDFYTGVDEPVRRIPSVFTLVKRDPQGPSRKHRPYTVQWILQIKASSE